MEKVWGEWQLEEEDYKKIAKRLFEDYKNDIIEYAEQKYAMQGDNEPIKRTITFEELWNLIDHCIFMEFYAWDEYEKDYIRENCDD